MGTVACSQAQFVGDRIGIDIHTETNGDKLDALADTGMMWVRVDANWNTLNPADGIYDWSVMDGVVDQATSRGLNVYPTLGYTPPWATDGPEQTGVPRDSSDWSDFVSAFVNRYKNRIEYFGIWNEPNATSFWTGTRQQFIDVIFKPAADAIHAADPNAKVVGPELAHFVSSGREYYLWLQDVLGQAGDKVDVVSHHTYPRPLSSSYTTVTSQLNADTLFGDNPSYWWLTPPSLREVLEQAQWNGPVWYTEGGWRITDMSPEQVAANYTGLMNDWLTGHPDRSWIDKIFFYHTDPDEYGVFNADGTSRPALNAIRDFVGPIPEPSGMILPVVGLVVAARKRRARLCI